MPPKWSRTITISNLMAPKPIPKQTGLIVKKKISQELYSTVGPHACTVTVKPSSLWSIHEMTLSNIVILEYAPI